MLYAATVTVKAKAVYSKWQWKRGLDFTLQSQLKKCIGGGFDAEGNFGLGVEDSNDLGAKCP